ncbi:type IV fimbrial assembly [Desulfocucumis palustris]|uniref:Type IV fimbrial assembly n=1 Tax=Desulfocucumis palustris TaxID=1898651 RepID=A0A2L2X9Y0_9FIRM|nr:ATPase, T2SS/T4P/T4SS family [Desulfocucumis palustris]GBF32754.1 type IV fimbrial assembly [Desulfocucumis palustris]
MKCNNKQNFLGSMLVNEKVITREQLEKALQQQSIKGGMIGKTLVQLGYCSEDDITRVLASRAGVPFISMESFQVDPAAVATLSAEATRRYKALPVAFDGDKLIVAMQKPSDIMVMDDLRIMTGYDISPVVVPDTELEAAIEKYSRESMVVEPGEEESQLPEDFNADNVTSSERPAVQLVNMIMTQAVTAGASDVHIELYEKYMRVRFRIDGVLHDIMEPPRRMHASLVSRLKVMANLDIAERRIPQDGRMSLKIEGRMIDIRVASLPATFGERITMRLLDRSGKMLSLVDLGLEPDMLEKYRSLIRRPYGLVLVTGPTGSGKTSTLYASLDEVDRVGKNVITVEDPVEYRLDGMNQVQLNPKAGLTFASGLRSILRNDPDIIMVGEIRDMETARTAIEAAMTGHLVFSTLHTNDAPGAISRLLEMGVEPFLIASSLSCVVAQRLARTLCPNCKEPYELSRSELEKIPDFPLPQGEGKALLYRPKGCFRCSNTGYRGRFGVYEFLFADEKIYRMTLERKSAQEIKDAAVEGGMTTLRKNGLLKVMRGVTSLEEMLRVVL